MENNKTFESQSKLSLFEGIGIIVGHGVGAGILSVPYLASLSNWYHFVWILIVAVIVSILLHLMIAELSYNNNGAMFVKCIENLFNAKTKKVFTIIAFIALGFSVLANCCAYINGGAEAIQGLIGALSGGYELNIWLCALIFYILCALIVFFGMKAVGICEKYCSFGMIGVMIILIIGSILSETHYALPINIPENFKNMLGLFGMLSFALSAVMSAPQVVKGFNGDKKKIRLSIIVGICLTAVLIVILTTTAVATCPQLYKKTGAINDIAGALGGWVGTIGFIFSIFALATSYWANSLDLRDIIHEQTKLSLNKSYLVATIPCLLLAVVVGMEFVDFTAFAGGVQILTALGIVVAFHFSRKKCNNQSPLLGIFGSIPFQIAVLLFNALATVGELLVIL